jgi:hypothetical protein
VSQRVRFPAAVALVAVAALACGGGGSGATTAPGGATTPPGQATRAPGGPTLTRNPGGGGQTVVDACRYLTADDIRQVTGLEITSTDKAPQFGIFASACAWELTNDEVMVPPSIALGIIVGGGKSNYDQYFGPFYSELGYEPLDGLGDKAADAGAGSVLVLSGDDLFELQYLALRDDDTEIAAELAKKVIEKLGR